ncbi:hypothetical protein [Arthrobacter sp. 8AJ]|uniref:hypothetical protein n=1 Tax=Arthrobacter sp. 8AJ TaxID=2653130 RepID=UPI0012F3E1E7|nr:hypothetical protein [Arthrobacter sp. 8AJ]VXB80709.1 conserved hypothetical protein [Arthrobacter sp. 8AJ]
MSRFNTPTTTTRDFTGMKVGAAVLVMVSCFGIGAISTSARTVEVERVVEVPVEKIVTKMERVEVTPASCLLYVSQSEEALSYIGEALGYARNVVRATSLRDAALMDAANLGLDDVNLKLESLTPRILDSKARCRDQ